MKTSLSIQDELESLDHVILQKEKVFQFLLTLPPNFDAFTLACSLGSHSFQELVNAFDDNCKRREKLGTWKAASTKNVVFVASFPNRRHIPFKPTRGIGKF